MEPPEEFGFNDLFENGMGWELDLCTTVYVKSWNEIFSVQKTLLQTVDDSNLKTHKAWDAIFILFQTKL